MTNLTKSFIMRHTSGTKCAPKFFSLWVLALLLGSTAVLAQPAISSISPLSAIPGATVTINGSNFSSTASNDIVFFNGIQGTVTSATSTQLKVTVPTGAMFGPVSVTVSNKTAYSTSLFNPTLGCSTSLSSSSLTSAASVTVGNGPQGGVMADLDGDGKLDMVICNTYDSTISIFRNTSVKGTISFDTAVTIKLSSEVFQCCTGDLNGDGKLDIVVGFYDIDYINVLQNSSTPGSLSFSTVASLYAPSSPSAIKVQDMDADGKPDIIVNGFGTAWYIFKNGISGSISASSFSKNTYTYSSGVQIFDMQVGDMNGDGLPDVVMAELSNAVLHTYINNGSLSFTDNTHVLNYSSVWGLALVDLNKDGKLDVVGSSHVHALFAVPNTSSGGTLSWGTETDVSYSSLNGYYLAASDLNGDGNTDIVFSNASSGGSTVILPNTYSSGSSISLGTPFNLGSNLKSRIPLVGDLDGDGKPDIYILNLSNKTAYGFRNISGSAIVTATGPQKFCSGDSVQLKANTGAGYSYQWIRNDTLMTGDTNSVLYVKASGRYKLSVTSSGGCSDTSAADTVTVYPLPSAAITATGATATSPGAAAICAGNNLTLSVPNITTSTYQWKKDGINISGATSASYTTGVAGSYTVTVTNSSGCTVTSATAIAVTVNAVPSASIFAASATTFCQGGSVVLYANTGTGLTYQWYKDAAAISGATSSSYTASAAGNYTVAVTNSSNCTITSSAIAVSINNLPTATISASGATSFCSGSSVDLNVPTGTGLSYAWFVNGTAISGASSATYTATTSGDYTVTVTNANGCSSTSSATTLTVYSLPNTSVNVIGTATRCQGDSVLLTANKVSGYTYQWKLNGANISGAKSASFSATKSGMYKVVITNSNGCTDSSAGTSVNIIALPTAVITSPSSPLTFCSGGSVTLNAVTGSGYKYQWQSNGANISGANASFYTASQSGAYTVVVTNANGCSAVSSATNVTVNPLPSTTVTPYGSTTRCQGDSVILSANAASGYTYQWKLNGIAIAGANASSYAAKATGTYKVSITNASGCTDSSLGTIVTINPLPSVKILASTSTSICAGASAYLSLSSTTTGTTYQWQKDGKDVPGANSTIYLASQAGSYTVKATNANGCSNISNSISVIVNPLPTPAVSPLGATSFCEGDSVTLITAAEAGNKYQWQLNNADIAGANGANITVKQSGDYKVVVTNASGCTDSSKHVSIKVNPLPDPLIFAFGPTTFCEGSSVILKTKAAPANTQAYQWYLNNTVLPGDTSYTITATKSGVYTLVQSLKATGCSITSNTITVNAMPAPASMIEPIGKTTFCKGSSIILYAGPSQGYQYYWFKDSTFINTGNVNTLTVTDPGIYTLVTQDSATGCSGRSKGLAITVLDLPEASIIAPSSASLCEGASTILRVDKTKLPAGNNSYQWSANGIAIPGATADSLLVNGSANYTVTVTSEAGCSNTSAVQNITFNTLPVVKYTFTRSVCAGTAVSFLNKSFVASGQLTYLWTFGDGDSSTAESPAHAYKAAGKYKIALFARSGSGCISMLVDSISVHAISGASFTKAHNGPHLFGFTALDSTGVEYKWLFGDGQSGSGKVASHDYFVDGTYLVTLQVTNASGCVTSVSDSVAVNSTGIDANADIKNSFSIYPNPFIVNANITYSLEKQGNVTLEVYDVLGKKVETIFNGMQSSGKYVYTFDGPKQAIPSDVYFIRLRVDDNVYMQRLVRVQ